MLKFLTFTFNFTAALGFQFLLMYIFEFICGIFSAINSNSYPAKVLFRDRNIRDMERVNSWSEMIRIWDSEKKK